MKNKLNRAFTLIELLVVITIIALLVSILMPSLNKAKQQATATVCLGNQKSLITAWIMYSGENRDKLIGGMTSSYRDTGGNVYYRGDGFEPAGKYAWACATVIQEENDRNATDADLSTLKSEDYRKRGLELGDLWKYVKTSEIYHCPGDKNYKLNKPFDSYVTYSINATMNGEDVYPGHNGVKAYTNSSQIKNPVEKMVFVEENTLGQSFLRGSFMVAMYGPDFINDSVWWDYPANWHNKKGTMSFVDGHAELTQWESSATLELAELTSRISFSVNDKYCKDNPDLKHMIRWYGGIK